MTTNGKDCTDASGALREQTSLDPAAHTPPTLDALRNLPLSSKLVPTASYALGAITGIAILQWTRYKSDAFVRFSCWQSIFANGAYLLVREILLSFGGDLASAIRPVITLAGLALWGLLIYKSYRGEKFSLPILGALAERQAAVHASSTNAADGKE